MARIHLDSNFRKSVFFSFLSKKTRRWTEPGAYKHSLYGMRLKNVLEVYDTGKKQEESGARFLGFRDVSLVPFNQKLIDRGQLSLQDVNWEDEIIADINFNTLFDIQFSPFLSSSTDPMVERLQCTRTYYGWRRAKEAILNGIILLDDEQYDAC